MGTGILLPPPQPTSPSNAAPPAIANAAPWAADFGNTSSVAPASPNVSGASVQVTSASPNLLDMDLAIPAGAPAQPPTSPNGTGEATVGAALDLISLDLGSAKQTATQQADAQESWANFGAKDSSGLAGLNGVDFSVSVPANGKDLLG